jgi:hypothetical protein
VVVDKGKVFPATRRLQDEGWGVWQNGVPGLDEMGPADPHGNPPIIGPYGSREDMPGENPIGPVRVAGFRGRDGQPLLHAKVLLLGVEHSEQLYPEGFGIEAFRTRFQPKRLWLGSANWTEASRRHLEFGAWTDDPQLCERALGFLGAVLHFSEPMDSTSAAPAPELLRAEWDDAAFAEALMEAEWAAEEAEAIAHEDEA